MTDRAISLIAETPVDHITFQWFRTTFKADYDQKAQLDYGHAVIASFANLDQYLYTYGPMIESQWECVDPILQRIAPPARVIDYGCGQGIAGLLVNDLTRGRLLAGACDIVLIEPSRSALDRATALYRRIAPRAAIAAICERFDGVINGYIPQARGLGTLHVFSNALDLLGFDAMRLLQRTLQSGRHTILAVSPNRNFRGGTPQIEATKVALEGRAKASGWAVRQSTLDRFTCSNPSRSKAVAWYCELEIP